MPPDPLRPKPAGSGDSKENARTRWIYLPASRSRRIGFLVTYGVFCLALPLLLPFLGMRLFWQFYAGVPLHQTALEIDYFYPQIRKSHVNQAGPRHSDQFFDVLLLGGSVLELNWGSIETELKAKLRKELGECCRVFNLSCAAHTSRDSLIKYVALQQSEFELVIVYDGINDVRMNYCPPEKFRDDYSHFNWYDAARRCLAEKNMQLPASLMRHALPADAGISTEEQKEWVSRIGAEVRTSRTLRRNFDELLDLAERRGDSVLMMTFACDLPADYTRERFESHQMGYGTDFAYHACDAEMWGRPEYVTAAVDAQNREIHELADQHPGLLFTDQDQEMPRQTRLFADPCHLTDQGSRRFVENLWPQVQHRVDEWLSTRRSKIAQGAPAS